MSTLPLIGDDVREVLLRDVAVRVQLPPSSYRLAQERIETLAQWLDREGSPLAGRVRLVYPQGSMAIGATVAACLKWDEFDIDVIVQMDLLPGTTPQAALELLYRAVRGESGSRYYRMTKRNTRCVTVEYAGMHVDLTPAELIPGREPRVSFIFHHRPEEPNTPGKRVVANPFGFAEWFNAVTPHSLAFEKAFESQSRAMDPLLEKAADTDEVPAQMPAYLKPPAVVALQLLKRFRNVRYEKRDGRRPPGVLLACLVGQSHTGMDRLFDELLSLARMLHGHFARYQQAGKLIHVANPRCPEDVFSDRWPAHLAEQAVFVRDLEVLVTELESLEVETDLEALQTVFSRLFGEELSKALVREFADRSGRAIDNGTLRSHRTSGRIDLAGSGILSGGVDAITRATTRTASKHTFFGTDGDGRGGA
jgi:hypothetical protein